MLSVQLFLQNNLRRTVLGLGIVRILLQIVLSPSDINAIGSAVAFELVLFAVVWWFARKHPEDMDAHWTIGLMYLAAYVLFQLVIAMFVTGLGLVALIGSVLWLIVAITVVALAWNIVTLGSWLRQSRAQLERFTFLLFYAMIITGIVLASLGLVEMYLRHLNDPQDYIYSSLDDPVWWLRTFQSMIFQPRNVFHAFLFGIVFLHSSRFMLTRVFPIAAILYGPWALFLMMVFPVTLPNEPYGWLMRLSAMTFVLLAYGITRLSHPPINKLDI